MDRTTKMPRAPLSPRGGWITGCGTFDTAYLEDGNAQNSGHRDCGEPFCTTTLARSRRSFGRDQHLGPQALRPQGKELGHGLGDRLPRSRADWQDSKVAFHIGLKESALATCNLKSSAQPAAD